MYSMVTSSPALGLSVPLPLVTIFLVTPIVANDETGCRASYVASEAS